MAMAWWLAAALAGTPLVVEHPDLCVAGGVGHPAKACPGLPPTPVPETPDAPTVLLAASAPDGDGQAVLMVMHLPRPSDQSPPDDRSATARDFIAGFVDSFGTKVAAASALPSQGLAHPEAPFDQLELRGAPAVRYVWNDVVTTHGALLFTPDGMVSIQGRSLEGSDAAATLLAAALEAIEVEPGEVVDGFDPSTLRPTCLAPSDGSTSVGPRYRPYAYEPPPGLPARTTELSVRYPILQGTGHLLVVIDPAGVGIDGNTASEAERNNVVSTLTKGLTDRGAVDVRGAHSTTRGCTHVTAEGRFGDARHRIDWVLDGRTVVGVECRAPVVRDADARALCDKVFASLQPLPVGAADASRQK